jgi:hypothetical protein
MQSWLPTESWPEWDPEVVRAMRRFQQGDLLKWSTIVYGAAFEYSISPVTKAVGSEGMGYVRVDDSQQHVIITSQTCDICEEGKKKPIIPWITVAPVYNVLPRIIVKGQERQIRTRGIGYLVPITAMNTSSDSLFVADLRFEQAVEKSILVGQDVVGAFLSPSERNDFGESLAFRRNRPAIDSNVRDSIIQPLRKALSEGIVEHSAILEVRLAASPDFGSAQRAQLHVVVDDEVSLDALESSLERWYNATKADIPSGLMFLRPTTYRYSQYPYALAQASVRVDYSEICE